MLADRLARRGAHQDDPTAGRPRALEERVAWWPQSAL